MSENTNNSPAQKRSFIEKMGLDDFGWHWFIPEKISIPRVAVGSILNFVACWMAFNPPTPQEKQKPEPLNLITPVMQVHASDDNMHNSWRVRVRPDKFQSGDYPVLQQGEFTVYTDAIKNADESAKLNVVKQCFEASNGVPGSYSSRLINTDNTVQEFSWVIKRQEELSSNKDVAVTR